MRTACALPLLLLVLGLTSCGSDDDDGGSSCALRTTGLAGEAPDCLNTLECGDDEWELDCATTTGDCECRHNGVVEKTIPYDDSFCPADFSSADFDVHEAAAKAACGWP